MKILVLSDSHISRVKPDAVVHLGDYYDDGAAMAEEYPHIRMYQVPGNCDRYRVPFGVPETLVEKVCGVKLMMTHGHIHRVKWGLGALIADARTTGVQGVLFGHTHESYCECVEGLWVINPGSCGYGGGSGAVITVEDGKISDCRIIRQSDL